jgi:hypothetical protein
VTRPRAADDFPMIRARMEERRRERARPRAADDFSTSSVWHREASTSPSGQRAPTAPVAAAARQVELLEEADQSGATIGRGGQLTKPQDISPRRDSRYNNGLRAYFFGPIEERRNEHPRRIYDFGLLRNSR